MGVDNFEYSEWELPKINEENFIENFSEFDDFQQIVTYEESLESTEIDDEIDDGNSFFDDVLDLLIRLKII